MSVRYYLEYLALFYFYYFIEIQNVIECLKHLHLNIKVKKRIQVVTRGKQIRMYLPGMVNNQGGQHKQKRDKIYNKKQKYKEYYNKKRNNYEYQY